jgi:heme oxygenase (biliverdin-IX-beta and delta-forming)
MAASPDLFRQPAPRALDALRASTREVHLTLDEMPLMRRVMADSVDVDDYRAFLRAQLTVMERWWAICPVCVADAAPETVDARSAGLRDDLTALGRGDDSLTLLWPRQCWPSYSAQWWGALYVIEGSRIGACAVADRIEAALGSSVQGATRFLQGRRDARTSWLRLLSQIEQRVGDRIEDAVDGAHTAYRWYAQCFALAMLERESELQPA